MFKVNLGGMIDLLSNHLYSSPDVFVRELLQNGSDAISAAAKNNSDYKNGKITLSVDNGKSIVFNDTGTGLTEDEIHKFLTENGDKLLPEWSFFLRCFINTKGLRPTASREDFYEDDALECARQELSECISDYLQQLECNNKRLLGKIISVHSLAIKSIATENDELFKTFIPYLTFETSSGEMTGKQIADYKGSIVYTNVVDTFRQMSAVYMAQDELLVNAGYVYEQALIEKMAVINSYMDISMIHMECIDELLSDVTEKERTSVQRFIDTANEIMDEYDCQIDIRHFQPSQLPSLFAVNEDADFLRDINHSKEVSNELFSQMLDVFAEQHRTDASAKLYLNMDNELIQKLITADDEKKIKCYIEILYVQSLLAGNFPMRKGELKLLNDNLMMLLEWSAGI